MCVQCSPVCLCVHTDTFCTVCAFFLRTSTGDVLVARTYSSIYSDCLIAFSSSFRTFIQWSGVLRNTHTLKSHLHACQSAPSAMTSRCRGNKRSTCKGTESGMRGQAVPAETTPINHLINHIWLIWIFATYSQSSFINANPESGTGSREREVRTETEPVGC